MCHVTSVLPQSAIRRPKDDESSNLEREIPRGGGHSREMMSYEDPLSLQSHSAPHISASLTHSEYWNE